MSTATEFFHSWRWGTEYFRTVRPAVIRSLGEIRSWAEQIPHPDLREQALSSLTFKQFHCEGGGVFGGPSRDPNGHVMEFLVPYQTLCDYLDTVTDRGPSQDPEDLRWLHQSLLDAVSPQSPARDYYALHPHQDDGGYITRLIAACHQSLQQFPGFSMISDSLTWLAQLYVDLQVFKHGPINDRVPHLEAWFHRQQGEQWGISWWEFAAAAGSTLGLFALLNLAAAELPSRHAITLVKDLYFPWIGSLHILLDYLIDRQEDLEGGDLNFVSYYPDYSTAVGRLQYIYRKALSEARKLPDAAFHRYISRGLLGFYLSDQKMRHQIDRTTCGLLASGGSISIGVWLAARVGRSP
ncbi:MAG: tetraprenyl-beta-curcumene synthase family protein [Firmicutes bacterium]|jgi:tetraprenyl-beta-curcumene synthase|nr:tetraprenyl-beta-curcumene synthase family protein [Bacillota bacterium]